MAALMTDNNLRWLVTKRFAEHGQETSVYGDRHRSFQLIEGFNFEDASCLVLTPSGAKLADLKKKIDEL